VTRVLDLSATPFFLRGSGYAEGTLFPWTMSDFSLMDAIECGIVKLPRVPVAENIPGDEMPVYRNLWENIRKDMPKKGRGQGEELDPLKLPIRFKLGYSFEHSRKRQHHDVDRPIGDECDGILFCPRSLNTRTPSQLLLAAESVSKRLFF
jgi:hypothetical protein